RANQYARPSHFNPLCSGDGEFQRGGWYFPLLVFHRGRMFNHRAAFAGGNRMTETTPLWTPSAETIRTAPLTAFIEAAAKASGRPIAGYDALHAWSVDEREAFWSLLWEWGGIVGERGERVLENGDRMPGARFFPDARLNFAENLLNKSGDGDALVFRGEDKVARRLSWNELRDLVSRLQQLFRAHGIQAGDRIAAMMPNMPETVACM